MSSSKHSLRGKVALVTGATRGLGKGIALQLCEAGAKVYVTGRTLKPKAEGVGGSLQETIEEMNERGGGVGLGVPVQCDHGKDEDIVKLFEKIDTENDGQLDLLVNNAYSAVGKISEQFGVPFWEQPLSMWDDVNNVGLRNYYLCAVHAAKRMVPRKTGLIVNLSSPGGIRYLFNVPYGVGKAAKDRMMADCAVELKGTGVACISLWPGAVKTEQISYNMEKGNFRRKSLGQVSNDKLSAMFEKGESAEFPGKCIAALLSDPNLLAKSGRILMTADLATEYGVFDVDGGQPASMRSLKAGLRMLGGIFGYLADFVPGWIKVPAWVVHLTSNKF